MRVETKVYLYLLAAIWLVGFYMACVSMNLHEPGYAFLVFGPPAIIGLFTTLIKTESDD